MGLPGEREETDAGKYNGLQKNVRRIVPTWFFQRYRKKRKIIWKFLLFYAIIGQFH